jgi:hypothetical protein
MIPMTRIGTRTGMAARKTATARMTVDLDEDWYGSEEDGNDDDDDEDDEDKDDSEDDEQPPPPPPQIKPVVVKLRNVTFL